MSASRWTAKPEIWTEMWPWRGTSRRLSWNRRSRSRKGRNPCLLSTEFSSFQVENRRWSASHRLHVFDIILLGVIRPISSVFSVFFSYVTVKLAGCTQNPNSIVRILSPTIISLKRVEICTAQKNSIGNEVIAFVFDYSILFYGI